MDALRQIRTLNYLAALAMVALAALGGLALERVAPAPNLSLIFVLPVVISAAALGWRPSLFAALTGALAYNYFLVEPRFTLRVADPANVWAIGFLLATGAVVSVVAGEARRRALMAREAAARAEALRALASGLVAETTVAGLAARCAEALSALLEAPAVVLVEGESGLALEGAAGEAALGPADEEAARWALSTRTATRGGAYPVDGAVFDFWPLVTPQRRQAVVGLAISGKDAGRPDRPERLMEPVLASLAVALDREQYARQLMAERMETARERIKGDLLAAVSHDLRTPLSTVVLALQSLLKFDEAHDARARRELLRSAAAEASRLEKMVEGLLAMNRLAAGGAPVRPAPVAPQRLVGAAARRARTALAGRKLTRAAVGAPLLVDEALFETALANVLENAGKYTPKGSTIEVHSGASGAEGWVEVRDEGPGFGGEVERLVRPFERGKEGDGRPPGLGLGLAIARGFLEAQGGRLEAGDRAGGRGAWVRLIAPLAGAS